MKKIVTLVLVHDDSRVLLGLKKRGFGEGLWNGFGGKVHANETIEQAAVRELQEEAGIVPNTISPRGVIQFTFRDTELEIEMHVFAVINFKGEPTETEEMRPKWFDQANVPYINMWSDDLYWMPLVLAGKSVRAQFHFDDPDTQTILHKEIIINE